MCRGTRFDWTATERIERACRYVTFRCVFSIRCGSEMEKNRFLIAPQHGIIITVFHVKNLSPLSFLSPVASAAAATYVLCTITVIYVDRTLLFSFFTSRQSFMRWTRSIRYYNTRGTKLRSEVSDLLVEL